MVRELAVIPWPEVEHSRHPWRRDNRLRDLVSRARFEAIPGEYEAATPALIASREVVIPPALLAEVEAATAALHRFDAEMGREIAPFSAVLLRSESASSSQIERITASARAIARAELGDESRANAAAIVANTRAMQAAIRLADNVDLEAILAMHAALMESSRDSEHAGVIRAEQVWIGGDSLSPAGAEFVPPHHESLPPLLADLVQFVARTDIPALAHAAIAHAQFETIHPFVDGNGRTGRALIHAMLRAARVSRHVSFPISAGLLAEIGTYFDSLTAYRAGDAGPIVEQFVDASYRAVENGRALVDDLEQIRSAWRETVQVRDGSRAWDVADLMLQRPAVDVALLRSALGIRAENVARALAPLVDAGIVRRFGGGRAGVVYEAPAVFDALDAFARRAGRRQIRGR